MLDDYAARETKWQSYEKVGDRRAVAVTSGPVPPVEMLWRSDKNRFEAVTHPSGTESSNPLPSTGESATNRAAGDDLRATDARYSASSILENMKS
jgi:hypothetical protein